MDPLVLLYTIVSSIVSLTIMLVLINILQNGWLPKHPRPVTSYFAKPVESVTPQDLFDLSKSDIFQLFHSLAPPEVTTIEGEYRAMNHPQGILSPLIEIITSRLFGPGQWIGKGFRSVDGKYKGYNRFKTDTEIMRGRPFVVSQEISEIDQRPVLKLKYRPFNSDLLVRSMRDELRMLNSSILIGMGITTWGLGAINPAHFILFK